jgi:hypothetical protein
MGTDTPELTKIVKKEADKSMVVRPCMTYGIEVQVPKDIYEASNTEQQKGIKQDHVFPGGYISRLGGIFSSYGAFHDFTQ